MIYIQITVDLSHYQLVSSPRTNLDRNCVESGQKCAASDDDSRGSSALDSLDGKLSVPLRGAELKITQVNRSATLFLKWSASGTCRSHSAVRILRHAVRRSTWNGEHFQSREP